MKIPLLLIGTLFLLINVGLISSFNFEDKVQVEVGSSTVNIYQGNFTNLSQMADVNLAGLADDDIVTWDDATKRWIAEANVAGGDIEGVLTPGPYLYGGCTSGTCSIYENETKLNATIDARDSDTTYTNGSGISLVGTEFNHSDTSSQASDDNSGNTFIQDIILDGFGHITSIVNAAVDFSAYVAITDLVGLVGNWSADKGEYYNKTEVNDSFVPYTGATSNLDLGNNNFSVGGTDFFVNNIKGNVGIGTTNPTAKLEINGTGNLLNIINASGSSVFFVNSSGNVGIGTVAPEHSLEINTTDTIPFSVGGASTGGWRTGLEIDTNDITYGPTLRGTSTRSAVNRLYWDGELTALDDKTLIFGTGADAGFKWKQTGPTGTQYPHWQLFAYVNSTVRGGYITIVEAGAPASNTNRYPDGLTENPILRIYAGGSDSADDYLDLYHDQTNAVFGLGSGSYIFNDGNVGIGTTNPQYPLHVNTNTSLTNGSISLYTSGNISATGFITRTSIFDKTKNVWDYIKDADYYKDNSEINHSKFYGYSTWTTADITRPEIEFYNEYVFNETSQKNNTISMNRIIYPYTKIEEGVLLDDEIDVLRQAVFELKQENEQQNNELVILRAENQIIKLELCKQNNIYSWCK